ncbi:MAG: ribosome maturation factor RimP [Ruminococcus sp.]|nr:ribosome maturation factor RimP [Ruminococcus sp.]
MKLKKFGGTEKMVYDMVLPIAEELGFEIWDVSFEKEGAYWYLRVFIDHEDGITIDDCEKMTRPVNQVLDEKDPISQNYILEVGSAGLERALCQRWHFERCIGETVKAHAIRPVDGEKEWIGILSQFDGENINIELENEKTMQLRLSELSYVKLYVEIYF